MEDSGWENANCLGGGLLQAVHFQKCDKHTNKRRVDGHEKACVKVDLWYRMFCDLFYIQVHLWFIGTSANL